MSVYFSYYFVSSDPRDQIKLLKIKISTDFKAKLEAIMPAIKQQIEKVLNR
jgi:hypothetical protein